MNARKSNKAAAVKKKSLRSFWASRGVEGGVEKLETGIKGFDEMLEGGLPKGRCTMVSAGSGSGKTVLLCEFLYRGATLYKQPGLFVTFEERPDSIRRNLKNFGWDLDAVESGGLLHFLNASKVREETVIDASARWLEPLLLMIANKVKVHGIERIAIDNLGSAMLRYGASTESPQWRDQLFQFADDLAALGVTSLITTESRDSDASLARHGVSDFVADGLIELETNLSHWAMNRYMAVRKMRGCAYRSGRVAFEIGNHGMEVFPKIPINTKYCQTDFDDRVSIGVPGLDRALGGGIPQGHILLLTGNTGCGKTTLALHYAQKGLENGEGCVWLALEEPVDQIIKTAGSHGWDLQGAIQRGQFKFVTGSLLNLSEDKLLYRIIDAVREADASRVVVDSVSSMESAMMSKENVRDFMLQLAGFAKTMGITVIFNYLSGDTFGASERQLLGSLTTNSMRLSSVVDGLIVMRYVERDQKVQKLLNILKLRGSAHDKDIFQYEIDEDGFRLGSKFQATG